MNLNINLSMDEQAEPDNLTCLRNDLGTVQDTTKYAGSNCYTAQYVSAKWLFYTVVMA